MTPIIIGALLIGIVAGALSGLLGVGGGVVIVPFADLALGQSQHVAQGLSLAVIIPTAIAGAWTSARRGNVDVRIAVLLAIGAVVGSVVGSSVANDLPQQVLRRLFAVVLVIFGYRTLPLSLRQTIWRRCAAPIQQRGTDSSSDGGR